VSTLAIATPGPRAGERSRLLPGLEGRSCEAIGWREFGLRHSLAGEPLLSLDALAQLADALPAGAVERHEARQPLLVPGGCAELAGRPSETVRGIETNGRWMVLWNIEQVAPYRRLLDAVLDEAARLLPPREGGMGRREAFLFLSAPHAVTPVHFDPEHNFLLQIRGSKDLRVGRFPDRAWELRELDRYHDGGHRNLERVPPQASAFQLLPGDGAYLYPWVPHWVYNGPTPSVSLSITFRTPRSERIELAHALNGRLRKRGWAPTPAGQSDRVDRPKAALMRLAGWLRRRGRPQRGARDCS
jgi:hypothetical protein